ncbi:hypothetical protein B9479_006414 [Cryptococcus floricola]|uniref:Uncharacterized protein n=1 Tax=Cryptococcus floricola TaxID=2591691 RepID=A0A5D3ANE0_9TREE|nr:hypothetical protein B9479_006414 [Cryptococcus floricola]
MWVASFLRGALDNRVSTALLNDELHLWLKSWYAFKKYLIANYGQSKGECIAGATQALQLAAQGTHTARDYLNALYGAVDLIQPISLVDLIPMVKQGLNPGLRDRLLKPAEQYFTYEDFREEVQTQDSLWHSEGGHLRNSTPVYSSTSSQPTTNTAAFWTGG